MTESADLLRVGIVAPIFNNMPVWIGQAYGHFEREGLRVVDDVRYSIPKVTEGVLTGELEVAIGTPESAIADQESGGDLTIVAGNAHYLTNTLIGRRGLTAIEELRGGVVGSAAVDQGTGLLMQAMLEQHGLVKDRDYELRGIGVASDRWELLQRGELDAGLQTPPHSYIAEEAGFPALGEIADYVPDYQFTTINVRASWASEHAGRLSAFLRGMLHATRFMADEQEATLDLAVERLGWERRHAEQEWQRFMEHGSPALDLEPGAEALRTTLAFMHRAGGVAAADDPGRYVDLMLVRRCRLEAGIAPSARALL